MIDTISGNYGLDTKYSTTTKTKNFVILEKFVSNIKKLIEFVHNGNVGINTIDKLSEESLCDGSIIDDFDIINKEQSVNKINSFDSWHNSEIVQKIVNKRTEKIIQEFSSNQLFDDDAVDMHNKIKNFNSLFLFIIFCMYSYDGVQSSLNLIFAELQDQQNLLGLLSDFSRISTLLKQISSDPNLDFVKTLKQMVDSGQFDESKYTYWDIHEFNKDDPGAPAGVWSWPPVRDYFIKSGDGNFYKHMFVQNSVTKEVYVYNDSLKNADGSYGGYIKCPWSPNDKVHPGTKDPTRTAYAKMIDSMRSKGGEDANSSELINYYLTIIQTTSLNDHKYDDLNTAFAKYKDEYKLKYPNVKDEDINIQTLLNFKISETFNYGLNSFYDISSDTTLPIIDLKSIREYQDDELSSQLTEQFNTLSQKIDSANKVLGTTNSKVDLKKNDKVNSLSLFKKLIDEAIQQFEQSFASKI
jgi:hypothetical protein